MAKNKSKVKNDIKSILDATKPAPKSEVNNEPKIEVEPETENTKTEVTAASEVTLTPEPEITKVKESDETPTPEVTETPKVVEKTRLEKLVEYYVKSVENGAEPLTCVAMQKSIIDEVVKGYPKIYNKDDLLNIVRNNIQLQGVMAHNYSLDWVQEDKEQKEAYYTLITFLDQYDPKTFRKMNKKYIIEKFTGKYSSVGEQLIKDFMQ